MRPTLSELLHIMSVEMSSHSNAICLEPYFCMPSEQAAVCTHTHTHAHTHAHQHAQVVMSMVKQFGARLPRPIDLWCLDCLPGDVRAGEAGGKDHPSKLIQTLLSLPQPLPSRNALVEHCTAAGAFGSFHASIFGF